MSHQTIISNDSIDELNRTRYFPPNDTITLKNEYVSDADKITAISEPTRVAMGNNGRSLIVCRKAGNDDLDEDASDSHIVDQLYSTTII